MEELRSGRSDLMLAGGVNGSIPSIANMVFSQIGALSPRSEIRPFDELADGTLLAEGAGIVVLKQLNDALAAGDRIYAVLNGIGQSSDGKGMGMLAPRLEGEILAIQRAYKDAGFEPNGLGLMEAHGTGIPLGDRTEVSALREVFGERDDDLPRIALGTIKSLISHCIPAAGIAGLIKAVLALHYRVLPPTICGEVSPQSGSTRPNSTSTAKADRGSPRARRGAAPASTLSALGASIPTPSWKRRPSRPAACVRPISPPSLWFYPRPTPSRWSLRSIRCAQSRRAAGAGTARCYCSGTGGERGYLAGASGDRCRRPCRSFHQARQSARADRRWQRKLPAALRDLLFR